MEGGGGGETGKGEPSKTSAEPNKPKLQRLNQNNGAMARGQEVKIGSPFGNRLHSFKVKKNINSWRFTKMSQKYHTNEPIQFY